MEIADFLMAFPCNFLLWKREWQPKVSEAPQVVFQIDSCRRKTLKSAKYTTSHNRNTNAAEKGVKPDNLSLMNTYIHMLL